MLPIKIRVTALAIGTLCLMSCGDDGYSFGTYGDALNRLNVAVREFCDTAISCVGRVYENDPEACRLLWLSEIFGEPPTEDCISTWIDVLECYEAQSCHVFPIRFDLFSASRTECQQERDAVQTCIDGAEP